MKLYCAMVITSGELRKKYKEVYYNSNEIVKLTKNSCESNFIRKSFELTEVEVEQIPDKTQIEGKIEAIKVIFDVKLPGKRKFNSHYEYYKII